MTKINTSLAPVLRPNADEIAPWQNAVDAENPQAIPQDPSEAPNSTGAFTPKFTQTPKC